MRKVRIEKSSDNTKRDDDLDTQSIDEQSIDKFSMSNSLSADELSADNYFKNAFYVFRALCKLSDRDIKDKGNPDPRYVYLFKKRKECSSVSLELIWI